MSKNYNLCVYLIRNFSKFREMARKLHQNLLKNDENDDHFAKFLVEIIWKLTNFRYISEIGAVKKNTNTYIVDLGILKNEYLLAKIGVDTAENEPPKIPPADVDLWCNALHVQLISRPENVHRNASTAASTASKLLLLCLGDFEHLMETPEPPELRHLETFNPTRTTFQNFNFQGI